MQVVCNTSQEKKCIVYKASPSCNSVEEFQAWIERAKASKHSAVVLVGAASSSQTTNGPSLRQSMALAKEANLKFGSVCIPERHMSRGTEAKNMINKQKSGSQWFITQGIYDSVPTIQLLKDYCALCKEEGLTPRKIILTFTPCGRRKTLSFIKWLGMHVPEDVESKMFAIEGFQPGVGSDGKKLKSPPSPLLASLDILGENLRRILIETADLSIPLGINVESVSGFRDEIDATHTLFRQLQAILLDYKYPIWRIDWAIDGGHNQARKNTSDALHVPSTNGSSSQSSEGRAWGSLVLGMGIGFLAALTASCLTLHSSGRRSLLS